MAGGGFGVFEFFLPSPVAMFLDQTTGFGEVGVQRGPRIRRFLNPQSKEPRPVEVDVDEEEGHGAALGDVPGFVQVAHALVSQSTACFWA
jgi:hypothetical protein